MVDENARAEALAAYICEVGDAIVLALEAIADHLPDCDARILGGAVRDIHAAYRSYESELRGATSEDAS